MPKETTYKGIFVTIVFFEIFCFIFLLFLIDLKIAVANIDALGGFYKPFYCYNLTLFQKY
jgi:hypothetical protein